MKNHFTIAAIFTLACCGPAFAQGQISSKVLAENDKMVVTETIGKPGESSPSASRNGQAYYYIQGGTLELGYADGKTAKVVRKSGEAIIVKDTRAYSAKNIGTTTLHIINVRLK